MQTLRIIAFIVIGIYLLAVILLYIFQTKLIFHPGKLSRDFKFKPDYGAQEVFLKTEDNVEINALFYAGKRTEVILYLHGNAGDLSGWQFVAEDFIHDGFNFLIIDYRGFGKSSGEITESGLYIDAVTAYQFLIKEKKFSPQDIIILGRSIGSGIAVDLASRFPAKGVVLETPDASFKKLASEKLPMMMTSLYSKFELNSISKINTVQCPIIFIHGTLDALIPYQHGKKLFDAFHGKKKFILIEGGEHNGLNAYPQYAEFVSRDLKEFFSPLKVQD